MVASMFCVLKLVLFLYQSQPSARCTGVNCTYLDPQISMHQHHKLPRLPTLIPNQHTRPQTIVAQRHRVNKSKVTIPRRLSLVTQVLWSKTKVQLYGVIDATLALRLSRRLAEELPTGGTRETVLWEGVGCWVVRRLAEDLYTNLSASNPHH